MSFFSGLFSLFNKDKEKFPYSKEEAREKMTECLAELEENIERFPVFEQTLFKEIKYEVYDVINNSHKWTMQESALKAILLEVKLKFLTFSMKKADGWKTK